jgi:hypothetical protein
MSRISQKPAVASIDPFKNISTGVPNQAFSANPANGAQPSGTGFFQPDINVCIGQKFDTDDGRELALVQNGTVALTAGVLLQSEAEVTAHHKLAMTVPTAYPATAGLFQILVTNGSTVLNANKFQGGYCLITAGTGIGQIFQIASHQQAANAATFVVTLEDPIQTTLDTSSKVTLMQNPYENVVISPITTATSGPVGVTLYNIAASTAPTYDGTSGKLTVNGVAQYGLIVTHGPTACLIDNTVTNVGYPLGVSKTTAGTLGVATLSTVPQVALSMQTLTSAETGLVYLML